jgi:hypothetical protein
MAGAVVLSNLNSTQGGSWPFALSLAETLLEMTALKEA